MVYYAKITANKPRNIPQDLFVSHGASLNDIVLDESVAPKVPGGEFDQLKKFVLETRETMVIDSLNSLGKNNREISKELQWFVSNGLQLIVLDLPSTASESAAPLLLLSELYSNLAAVEINNVKENQAIGIEKGRVLNRPLGRKKIPYPDNWEESYQMWERKDISASEFMNRTNLKKGTLYNLIKQYKEQERKSADKDKSIG